jgi:hypothetical protein
VNSKSAVKFPSVLRPPQTGTLRDAESLSTLLPSEHKHLLPASGSDRTADMVQSMSKLSVENKARHATGEPASQRRASKTSFLRRKYAKMPKVGGYSHRYTFSARAIRAGFISLFTLPSFNNGNFVSLFRSLLGRRDHKALL